VKAKGNYVFNTPHFIVPQLANYDIYRKTRHSSAANKEKGMMNDEVVATLLSILILRLFRTDDLL